MRRVLLLIALVLVGLVAFVLLKDVNIAPGDGGTQQPEQVVSRSAQTGGGVPSTPASKGVPAQPARLSGCDKVPNGNTCRLQGSGFGFGEEVTLTFANTGTPPQHVRADQQGNFTHPVSILSRPGVVITVQAQGRDSGRSASLSYTLT